MKRLSPIIILILIVLLGIVTRFYLLGKAPAGLYLDEAAQGYNAYSILKTGKDEFGKSFPVAFRSFNDFKTPIYIYLIVPLIPFFGLTPFSIRLPSFIFSIFTLPLVYLLIKKLYPQGKDSTFLALTSTLFLAISPWHILFGRTNFECNVALFFMLLGYYLFLLGLQKPIWFLFSAVSMATALPAYHSERFLVPIILIILLFKYWKVIISKSHQKYSLISLLVGVTLVYPTFKILATPGFMARVSTLNIFSTPTRLLPGFLHNYSGFLFWLVNNHWFLSTREFFSLYLFYFSPRSLFLLGDSGPRSSYPDLSVFFVWQLPLYLYGLYLLFKNKHLKDLRSFVVMLLVISPIPAALTRDPFSTIRSLPLVVPAIIIMALATQKIYSLLVSSKTKVIFWSVSALLIFYSLAKLYSSAIVLNEYHRALYWDYGWEQVSNVIKGLDSNLPVIVDNARGEPYTQLLVFLQFDPQTYQAENHEVLPENYYTNMKHYTTKKIGPITTRGINWIPDTRKSQYLVGDYLSISEEQISKNHLLLIKEISYPDGSPAFRIVKTQPEKTSR